MSDTLGSASECTEDRKKSKREKKRRNKKRPTMWW